MEKKENRNITLFSILIIIVFFIFFFKNAWVTEDAYISFRVVEQFWSGNGLRWNPHERVQVFTHPLWLFFLIIFRAFSSNVFLNAIMASFICCSVMVFFLRKIFQKQPLFAMFALLQLSLSKAFIDFSSSGLENAMSHMLITVFLFLYFMNHHSKKKFITLTYIFTLSMVNRLDTVSLLLIPWLLCAVGTYRLYGLKTAFITAFVGSLPIFSWLIFSVIYYGFPFPNTAYAKVYTGIPSSEIWIQGTHYLSDAAVRDPILMLSIIIMLVSGILSGRRKYQILSIAAVVNIIYIAKVGGDFMTGRFMTSVYLVSVIGIWKLIEEMKNNEFFAHTKQYMAFSLAISALYLLVYQQAPLFGERVILEENRHGFSYGIADERLFYEASLSFESYMKANLNNFPVTPLRRDARVFRQSDLLIRMHGNIGVFGYYTGTDKIIIDPLALSDPLLARLPAKRPWRIGHFTRDIPRGYLRSVEHDTNEIPDQEIHQLYDQIKIITQGPLFTKERWVAIWNLNAKLL